MERPPELINEIVSKVHSDLAPMQALIEQEPALVNAAWDWGGGDSETPLNSASHMGRRDIALYLLENSAQMDLPAAVILSELAIVKSIIEAHPTTRFSTGAHRIPLFIHAKAGDEEAADVLAYLQAFDA